jgi:hypothetical protein
LGDIGLEGIYQLLVFSLGESDEIAGGERIKRVFGVLQIVN